MRKGVLGFLTATHIVDDLYQGAVPALLPYLMAERHYSYAALSGISLAASGLSSVIQPLFGMAADRKSRDWLIPAGFLVAAAGIGAAGLARSYLVTWICIALAGLGVAAYHPAATSQARAAGGRSQQAMSLFSVGGTIGSSLAPGFVVVVVGTAGLSHSYLLAVPALAMGVLWVLRNPWMRWRGQPPAPSFTRPATPAGGTGSGPAGPHDDWRAFGWIIVVTIGWSIPYVVVASLLSLHAQHDLHLSSALGAVALTTFTLAGAVGTLLGGWVADRSGRLVAVRTGYLLSGPALAGIIWAPGPEVLLAGTAAFGVAMFLPFSSQVTLAQDYLPQRPGTASGLTLGLALSAGGLASPLFGWISDARGLQASLGVTLVVLLSTAVCAARLRDRILPETPSPQDFSLTELSSEGVPD